MATMLASMAGTPEVIGRYRIEGVLGAGGMGVVYAARDAALGRAVALKTIAAAAMADEQAQKRFWREARAAASVNHPNVCQIYEVGEADGDAVHRHGAAGGRAARRADRPRPAPGARGHRRRPRHPGRARRRCIAATSSIAT